MRRAVGHYIGRQVDLGEVPVLETFRSIARFPIHPLLFALHAVVSFYASNIQQLSFSEALRSLITVLIVAALSFAALARILKNPAKAASIISIGILLFFSFNLYSLYSAQLVLITVLVNWLVYFVVKSKKNWDSATVFFNIAACVALAFPLWIVARNVIETRSQGELIVSENPTVEITEGVERPNIYYIVLDGYGRADVLEELYQYPAEKFMDLLRNEGFYIADKSRSNYIRTIFSLASTFNMDTLEEFVASNNLENSHDEKWVMLFNYQNRFVKILQKLGYSTIGLNATYLGSNRAGMQYFEIPSVGRLNQFELKLLGQTPVHEFLMDIQMQNAFDTHRAKQIEALNRIPHIAQDYQSPAFVFAHILLPHPPFVFNADGNPIDPADPNFHIGDADSLVNITMTIQEYQKSYGNQIHYLNQMVLEMVKRIRKSDPGAVIVLQGDHGPGSQYVGNSLAKTNMHERSGILNAYLFPDADYSSLYPAITPANTFRVISNRFFKTEFELVEDTTYFSSTAAAYDFEPVSFE